MPLQGVPTRALNVRQSVSWINDVPSKQSQRLQRMDAREEPLVAVYRAIALQPATDSVARLSVAQLLC